MNREIIRRFLPLSQEFNLMWDEYIQTFKPTHRGDSSSESREDHADATCNCFAVSPKGTFLIAVVNEEILQLKYLPAGMTENLIDSV